MSRSGSGKAASRFRRPQRFDLNTLPLLDALLEERNVTRAGSRFDLPQPATSMALAKLRQAFEDELLVPVGRDLYLTPRAKRIHGTVRQLLALLDATLREDDEPSVGWSGEFIIASADAVAALVLPKLMDAIESVAPGATVRFTNITQHSVNNLRNDEIDLIIAPPQIVAEPTFLTRELFCDRFVVVHSKDRPAAVSSRDDYLNYDHIASMIDSPHSDGRLQSFFSAELDLLRATQRNVAILPYYALLPLLLIGTSRLALVQERLAKHLMRFLPIAYVEPPSPLPPLNLQMFWNQHQDEDLRHGWMRDTIFGVCECYR